MQTENDVVPPFVIRSASQSDAPALAEFAAAQFRATYRDYTPAADLEAYIAKNFTPERQSEEISDAAEKMLLATAGAQIIGYAHIQFEAGKPASAFLNRIYVDPDWKGKSLGSALLEEVVRSALERGTEKIDLTVYERNARAIAFYKRAGFVVTGTASFPVGDDLQTDLVMEKPLT